MINIFNRRKKLTPYQVFGINPQDLIFNDGIDYSKTSLNLNIEVGNIQKGNEEFILWEENTALHNSGNFDSVLTHAENMQAQMVQFGNMIKIQPAYAYELDENFESQVLNANVKLLKNQYLLLKYPKDCTTSISKFIFLVQAHHYKPLIILPHDYLVNFNFHSDRKSIDRLIGRNCQFQLNYLYLTGHFGHNAERLAKYLLDSGNTSLLGIKCKELHLITNQQFSMVPNKYAQLLPA